MPQRNLLATMITTTTFGTWLPGDLRGCVERGIILAGAPDRLNEARRRMTGRPVFLPPSQRDIAFDALIRAADEFGYQLMAVSIESWHVHMLVAHGFDTVPKAAGRLEARMRQAVDRGRIWTEGYDKRFCFDDETVAKRHRYINRHEGARPVHPPTH
jgi:REP element-mobilizing transposase RayT